MKTANVQTWAQASEHKDATLVVVLGLSEHARGQFPKACGCGRVFLDALDLVGHTTRPPRGEVGNGLWLRNCECGSTIAIELNDEEA